LQDHARSLELDDPCPLAIGAIDRVSRTLRYQHIELGEPFGGLDEKDHTKLRIELFYAMLLA
jgi:hypothetical protein